MQINRYRSKIQFPARSTGSPWNTPSHAPVPMGIILSASERPEETNNTHRSRVVFASDSLGSILVRSSRFPSGFVGRELVRSERMRNEEQQQPKKKPGGTQSAFKS